MTLDPLLAAPLHIQVHAFAALTAIPLGALVLWGRKGTPLHRTLGRLWVADMLLTATSALFIHEGGLHLWGLFGPIHLFVVLTLAGLAQAIRAIRRGDVAAHARAMRTVYVMALLLTGAFTLLPGRRMNAVLFGPGGSVPMAWSVIALILAAVLWTAWRRGLLARKPPAGQAFRPAR